VAAVDALRILVADDESIIRMGLQVILRDLGYRVVGAARDGAEALELVRAMQPDVAILDIKMPRMDGLEAAMAISQEYPIPIVILTAFSDREYIERAKSAPVHAYLVKPVREDKLVPTIELARAQFRQHQALAAEVLDLKTALDTRDLLDQAKGLLMQHAGLAEAQAFERIHRAARDSRRSVREVAQDIIGRYST
jgi:AmiR/NasT family two-component response regulator